MMRYMRWILSLLACCTMWPFFSFGQGKEPENPIALQAFYEQRVKSYLVKDKEVNDYFEIDLQGISVYASSADKLLKRPEFFVSWKELPYLKHAFEYADRDFQFELYKNKGVADLSMPMLQTIAILKQNHQRIPVSLNKPLSGMRIAIDPGHIAGDLSIAKIEGRFVDMKLPDGRHYRLSEGELNLATALVLRDSLRKQGAEVLLTRSKGNISPIGLTWEQWCDQRLADAMRAKGKSAQEIAHAKKKAFPAHLYRDYFLSEDLEARAAMINYFKPDLTIVIHYNADELNHGWKQPSKRNFAMLFVPGSYMKREMLTVRDRFDFLRTLVSDHTQESASLSRYVMDEMKTRLQIEPVTPQDEPRYLTNTSIKLTPGVYARNLRLCRLLNNPLCYGEPLLQDNEEELEALSETDLKAGVYGKRVIQIANCYYRGILKYAKLRNSK